MSLALVPDTVSVTQAWLKDVIGVIETGRELPADSTTWADSGYVQITPVGGTPHLDLPVARPLVQLDFWANKPNSSKAPWGKAGALAEFVRAATYDTTAIERVVTLPANAGKARVMSAYFAMEPRPIYPSDTESVYARYSADLALFWVRA